MWSNRLQNSGNLLSTIACNQLLVNILVRRGAEGQLPCRPQLDRTGKSVQKVEKTRFETLHCNHLSFVSEGGRAVVPGDVLRVVCFWLVGPHPSKV